MKKIAVLMVVLAIGIGFFAVGPAFAPLVLNTQSDSGSTNQDTSVVDLSDKNTDEPTWSPSFDNTTPAGQAPGGPIEE
jgi:hypothetical protein